MAGSYGFGITYSRNTTDHNYRKGLDIHDGNHITIENNTLNGDRLYGIGVYNRQFTMMTSPSVTTTSPQTPNSGLPPTTAMK